MLYKIAGGILIVISLIMSIGSFKDIHTMNSGKIVEVNVLRILTSCEVSNKSLRASFKFQYNNKIYNKNIEGRYCNIVKEGVKLKLKTSDDNTVFLYPDENLFKENISNIILFIIGILILLKKNKNG